MPWHSKNPFRRRCTRSARPSAGCMMPRWNCIPLRWRRFSPEASAAREIEAILDGLMDFGADDRFRALYQKLCRRIYPKYPTMVAEHILLWRSIYGPEAQAAQQESQPPAD